MQTKSETKATGPLSGIRVLDLGRYVAGPYAATLLGYMGAEVIRIERPSGGEDRYIAPLYKNADGTDGEGSVFLQTACNKKSLTLNFAKEEGQEIIHKLVQTADVVVVNLPPAALVKYKLDYDCLSALNPMLIYCGVTSFGASGPDANKGGFDGVGQALSGAMYMTGTPGSPAKSAAPYVDYSTAVLSALGIVSALYNRSQTGHGQCVETSLLGTALSVFNSHLIEQGALALDRKPTGNRVQTSGPSDVFACKDGHVLIHVVGPGLFKRVAHLINKPEWLEDDRFQSDQDRGDRRDELCSAFATWSENLTVQEALTALEQMGVPAGPVNTVQQALDNPQVAAMAFLKDIKIGPMQQAAPVADLPIRFSASSVGIKTPPHSLGADNDEILRALGYGDKEIFDLSQNQII